MRVTSRHSAKSLARNKRECSVFKPCRQSRNRLVIIPWLEKPAELYVEELAAFLVRGGSDCCPCSHGSRSFVSHLPWLRYSLREPDNRFP